jgi:mono/diheme cytochrome c family protein
LQLLFQPVAANADSSKVSQGAYLARIGACASCHTRAGGEAFSGGKAINTPFGSVYSTNITPDTTSGIGRYSEQDFIRAMREGVARDGHQLYPAMPYPSFSRVRLEDLQALYAYFMGGVAAVHRVNTTTQLPWPIRIRWLLKLWNMAFLGREVFVPDPGQGPAWNRGAYLVQGLAHCGACHTARSVAGQEVASSQKDGIRYLAGAPVDDWMAPSLRNDEGHGLRAWPATEIAQYLKAGRTPRNAAFGSMSEVVHQSTQYLDDSDAAAIAAYLKSLPGLAKRPAAVQAANANGARVYLDNCNACHASNGLGVPRTFPALAQSEEVNAPNPTSLIHLVLTGSAMPATDTAPSSLAMPGLGWRLSDDEVADVLSYIRNNWGNRAGVVSPRQVLKLRERIRESTLTR